MRAKLTFITAIACICSLLSLNVFSEGIEQLRERADAGSAAVQLELGWMYQNGNDVSQSDSEAFRWYHKAALQGLASAQSNLGLMYMEERGVPQNKAVALNWFHQAADKGHSLAHYNLGCPESTGGHVPYRSWRRTRLCRGS